uniref:NADH:flavin oxidoreductase/NADH oxidase N-terminal domain-containing protein n=1 Tax=Compsopogon caeruleus TaxID=31354 RepID=A0A7S1T9Q6_9RHOD|mmetsp:Transcript_13475/g.27542  ORF Transcript_13475/g.27542 Transcript_13475/m.27542 type:complete len:368 (+) Transcript_13475:127-1230(+)|eukprot:CAMPEP_0184680212 /NCGR_PEP_ID=MMETSP0312-20130426/3085_1 /TAXON_ID=31354 /ORGANISM="Compsopogon coeruleus, Strain SAG 36.94" /LENGTH=367 /DNA_ID=CAMNT_0027130169 /DNA_START=381 /DNA_END=1484 /DNA_ORIENTATION=+
MALFNPCRVGDVEVKTRVAMAPMTRGRADLDGNVPNAIMKEYYESRAAGGASLIITEGSFIMPECVGWYGAPGIWSDAQVEAWKPVVDAVHNKGSVIVLQLWHMGRQGHSDLSGGIPVVSSSPVPIKGEIHTTPGIKKPGEVPHELTVDEIATIVKAYGAAAQNAMRAGFDLVEIHAANGYLVDQFLQSCCNQRNDEYGGSVANRSRFLVEVVDEVLCHLPREKVGIRFSPNGVFGEMGSDDGEEQFTEAIKIVGQKNLAYVHIMDGLGFGFHDKYPQFTLEKTRAILKSNGADNTRIIGNIGYDKIEAEKQISEGHADLIAFGRPFLNTPNFGEILLNGGTENPPLPMSLWYQGGTHGYVDCPVTE